MAAALAAAAALLIALARLFLELTGDLPLRDFLRALAALSAAGAAGVLAAPFLGPAAVGPSLLRSARYARFAPALLGAGAAAPLAWLALSPRFVSGAAAARGLQGLGASALVRLAAYLCLHLRASLVLARWWLTLSLLALTGLAAGLVSGSAAGGARDLLPLAVLLALAAARTAALQGSSPGSTAGQRVPLGELAALCALASPGLWEGGMALEVAAGWLLRAVLLGVAVESAPALRGPAAAVLLLLAAAVLAAITAGIRGLPPIAGDGLACALVCAAAALARGPVLRETQPGRSANS